MKQFIFSLNSLVSWILKLFMLVVAVYFLFNGKFLFFGFALLSLSISLIPAIVNRSYDVNLPWSFDFLLTIWLSLSVLGELYFYERFWWWDNFLHFGGTAVLVYLAFVLVFALNFTKKIRLSIPMIGFFTFLVGVAFGALWELAEFYVWIWIGHDTLRMGTPPDYHAGLIDTFSDLKLDTLASLIVAIAGMKYVGNRRNVKLHEWLHPFFKIFGSKAHQFKKNIKHKIKR